MLSFFSHIVPHDEIITKNVDDPISPSWISAALGGIVVLPTCRGFKSQYLNLSNGIFINGFNYYCVSKQGDTFGKFCSHSPLFWYGLCYYYYYYLMTPSLHSSSLKNWESMNKQILLIRRLNTQHKRSITSLSGSFLCQCARDFLIALL